MQTKVKEPDGFHRNPTAKPLLLVFPYDVMAHYLRCIQLAGYLRPWFNIRFLSSKRYDHFIKEAGYEAFECTTLDAVKCQQGVESFDFSWLNEKDLSAIYNAQVQVIDQLQPAVVLGDMAPTLKMAAEKAGVSYIALLNGYLSKYYACVRKLPRKHPLYKPFSFLPVPVYRYFVLKGEKIYFEEIHNPFKKIRKREHLSVRRSYLEELEGDLNLICDLQELYPQKNLPPNYKFIGPLVTAPSHDELDICDKLHPAKKTLFVSMGSTGNWKKASFLNDPAYNKYNIVTAGDSESVVSGTNVFAYEFINVSALFQKVDLVICHGGNGTCYQALSYGIPVLCLSTHFEQEYNIEGLQRNKLVKNLDDISTKKYMEIIDDWMRQKGTERFNAIKQRIINATADAKESMYEIVDQILRNRQRSMDKQISAEAYSL